jgi:hypothetical protein
MYLQMYVPQHARFRIAHLLSHLRRHPSTLCNILACPASREAPLCTVERLFFNTSAAGRGNCVDGKLPVNVNRFNAGPTDA